MLPRLGTLAILAALTVSLAALPALALSRDCEEAQATFWTTWEAEGETFTRPVALAARAVVDACPTEPEAASSEGGENPIAEVHRTAFGVLDDAKERLFGRGDVKAQTTAKTMAALCGFAGSTTSEPEPALITGWVMLGATMANGTDEGVGVATFDAVTGYTHVNTRGAIWGIDANNQGMGTIYFHGVPFPLHEAKMDRVKANAGCGVPPGPSLCWGDAYGWSPISGIGSISALGRFYSC